MSRAQRLLELIQILRRHRYAVSGESLADELSISLRTLYRDIATLQAQGAPIVGEAGVGYVLQPGFMLPPLMFTEDEIEAIVLGSRWVAERADERLGDAATEALAKIAAVLPEELRRELDDSGLMIPPGDFRQDTHLDMPLIRQSLRSQRKLEVHYRDANDKESRRIVWPVALGYFEQFRIMVAWCELREDFRHFRTDRMQGVSACEACYPQARQSLLRQWRAQTLERRRGITTDRN